MKLTKNANLPARPAKRPLLPARAERTWGDRRATVFTGWRGLSARQQQVLELASHGLNRRQIAQHLGLQCHTISEHLKQVYRKLNVHNRVSAVALALRQGLLAAAGPAGPGNGAAELLGALCPHCGGAWQRACHVAANPLVAGKKRPVSGLE